MIEVERLSKYYGNRGVVRDVSFHVSRGEIMGFLGPNGAGKTTTMRLITGFIPPTSGSVRVAGFDVAAQPLETKARVGYLCEVPPLYAEMIVRGYLRFVAEVKRVPTSRQPALIDRAIRLCGLEEVADRVIGHLSKGYRQRVGLAQAILHQPPVLILDEPTVGLDPRQIAEIRQLIRGLGGEQTVVLSTHILPEVTMTCSRVVIINDGQIIAEDSIEHLTSGLGKFETCRVAVARDRADLLDALGAVEGVDHVSRDGACAYLVRLFGGPATRERLAACVVASGAGLVEFAQRTATLEDVFLKLITEEETGEAA